MARLVRILAIIAGLALAVVAGVFGAAILVVILIATAVFSLFGKGRVKVAVNRAPRSAGRPGGEARGTSPLAGGEVIDIEAKPVEPPKRELT